MPPIKKLKLSVKKMLHAMKLSIKDLMNYTHQFWMLSRKKSKINVEKTMHAGKLHLQK